MLDGVLLDGQRVEYSSSNSECTVPGRMAPGQTARLQFQYKADASLAPWQSNFVRSSKVMLRRHLTEIRDRYLS